LTKGYATAATGERHLGRVFTATLRRLRREVFGDVAVKYFNVPLMRDTKIIDCWQRVPCASPANRRCTQSTLFSQTGHSRFAARRKRYKPS